MEAPNIGTCPGISRETDPGKPTAMVRWAEHSATDNSRIIPAVECQPPSGHHFSIGATVVKCKATDNNGNTATCSFDVIVNGT